VSNHAVLENGCDCLGVQGLIFSVQLVSWRRPATGSKGLPEFNIGKLTVYNLYKLVLRKTVSEIVLEC